MTLFEPCIQPLLDDSILSPLRFSPFSPPLLYFPALCLSSPTSPAPEHLALATAPHITHVDLCVSGSGRSQVVPSCSFDSSRELGPQRGCEEQAAEGIWKVQRDWARGSVPRTLHESFFVLGSRFSLITSLGACPMPALHTLHSTWGGRRFLPYLSPLFTLETVQGQHQRAGRMKGHGLHYGYNIILVMLTGRKKKGHLCHLLVQAWARCLFLGLLSLDACAARSF